MKSKPCKSCGESFNPSRSFQKVCSPACAISYAESERIQKKAKEWRKEKKRRKDKLKTRSDWMREAQNAFNAYIRERDKDLPCISCGRHHNGLYQAGHYKTVGSAPELRFEELNCHKQCAPCNNHLSGNLVNYRLNLIKKIGEDRLEWLESHHDPKKYSIEEIKGIKERYRQLVRELRKKRDES